MAISSFEREQLSVLAREVFDQKPFFDEREFSKSVYSIFVIKKMIYRFLKTGVLNEKLLLNNIIIVLNTFDTKRSNIMFRIATQDSEFSVIKTCLLFLDAYCLEDDETETNEILLAILMDTAKRLHLQYKYEY